MLTQALTVTGNQTAVALPGSYGAVVFDLIGSPSGTSTKRRVSSTANATPQVLTISHESKGTGFKSRVRSVVRYDYTRNDVDLSTVGGIVPSYSCYLVIDRPRQSGGSISTTHVKDGIGMLLDVITKSGQLDKLLNEEN